MPNHVYHLMQISGEPEVIKEFVDNHFDDECFNLNSILPMPAALYDTTSPPDNPSPELITKYGADNWYDWKNKNWNTKWNCYDCSMENTDNELIEAKFSTAWDTPKPAFKELAELYPDLIFSLQIVEEGGDFGGTIDIVAGEVITDLTEAQWKEYAALVLGWVDNEEAEMEERVILELAELKKGNISDLGVTTIIANYISCNMEDFIKFSK